MEHHFKPKEKCIPFLLKKIELTSKSLKKKWVSDRLKINSSMPTPSWIEPGTSCKTKRKKKKTFLKINELRVRKIFHIVTRQVTSSKEHRPNFFFFSHFLSQTQTDLTWQINRHMLNARLRAGNAGDCWEWPRYNVKSITWWSTSNNELCHRLSDNLWVLLCWLIYYVPFRIWKRTIRSLTNGKWWWSRRDPKWRHGPNLIPGLVTG